MLVLNDRHQKNALWTAVAAVTTSLGFYFLISRPSGNRKRLGKKVSFSTDVMEQELLEQNCEEDDAVSITPRQAMKLIRQRRSIMPKQFTSNNSNRSEAVPRQVLDDMLEAARWAPSHHLTQPWHFVLFDTLEQRVKLGHFLANAYRQSCTDQGKDFSSRKYSKKIAHACKASYIIALCVKKTTRNPQLEEICSVSCAVQNMHLIASSYKIGAYWSSSVVFSSDHSGKNPPQVSEFLQLDPTEYMCLGWMFVGPYSDKWPQGRRKPVSYEMYQGPTASSPTNSSKRDSTK